jgi:hypothetical protein
MPNGQVCIQLRKYGDRTLGRLGVRAMCALASAALVANPAFGLNLLQWNGGGSLQAALNTCADSQIFDGVEVLADNNDLNPLQVRADFTDHTVVDLESFDGRLIVVGTNGQGQPYRLARQLVIPASTETGELRIQGGWLGNVDDVEYNGAVCDIQNSAVVFEGTRFSRYQLQDGNLNQPCTLENKGPLVVVSGTQAVETNAESGTGFTYAISRTVDFKDCTFQPILSFTLNGCTQVDFSDPLFLATGARIRLLRPVLDVQNPGITFDFEQTPIQCTSSLVHIEEAVFAGWELEAGLAGFLRAGNCPTVGTAPGLFLRDVSMTDGTGAEAGAVSVNEVTWARLVDCTFTDNIATGTADRNTGAVRLMFCDEAEVLDCVFMGNEGNTCGALTCHSDTTVAAFNRPKLWIHESSGGETRFEGNLGNIGAGALYVYSTDDLLIEGVEFSGNGMLAPGNATTAATTANVLWSSRTTAYTDPKIGFVKCILNGNAPGLGVADGAVRFQACTAYVSNCEFTGDNGPVSLRLTYTGTDNNSASIVDNRFIGQTTAAKLNFQRHPSTTVGAVVRNNLFVESEVYALDLEVQASGSENVPMLLVDGNTFVECERYSVWFRQTILRKIHLRNNLFWRTAQAVELAATPGAALSNLTISHTNLLGGTAAIDLPEAVIDATTVYDQDPWLLSDHQLKWDSPMMDAGTSTGTGQFLAYDFDLTSRDIGWHPVYDVVSLGTTQSLTNPVLGWFQADDNATISNSNLTLSPGSVIRVAPNKTLKLATNGTPGSVSIGSLTGARTALVGDVTTNLATAATSLTIGPTIASALKPTTIEGTIIHAGFSTELLFQNLNLELDNAKAIIYSTTVGTLFFKQCEGRIDGYNTAVIAEKNPSSNKGIKIFRGSFGVRNCVLDALPSGTTAPIYLYSDVLTDTTHHQISNCEITRGSTQNTSTYGLNLSKSVIRMTDSEIQDFPTAQLYQFRSSSHLEDDAYNEFTIIDPSSAGKLIQASDGNIWLCNGYNNFIRANENAPFVTHSFVYDPTPRSRDWSGNYWSVVCGQGAGLDPDTKIPLYAQDLTTWLPDCINTDLFYNHDACGSGGSGTLLKSGVDKQLAGDLAGAQADYQAVLNLGVTDESTEAALRLQSLGGSSEYGAENYEAIRAGLLAAATLVAETDPDLSTLYACNAWTVEAEHGDLEAAIEQLETIRDVASSPENRFNAELAIEEANIVGTPSGLSATHASLDARRERATQRLFELMEAGPGVAVAMETSSVPTKIDLGAAYPNPFNPVTTLPITIERDQALTVTVFNVLGQQVTTLLDGRLTAGTHSVRFDGQGLSSGMYLIQVKAEDGVRTRKIMLLQ